MTAMSTAYHNQKFPLQLLASWLLMSPDEVELLLHETNGVKIDLLESTTIGSRLEGASCLFNKKDFSLPPEDLFEARAAGKLSYKVLADMCQGKLQFCMLFKVRCFEYLVNFCLFGDVN